MAPDDAELKAVAQAGYAHVNEGRKVMDIAEILNRRGIQNAQISINDVLGTFAEWIAAYGEYSQKYCWDDEGPKFVSEFEDPPIS
jgi:hypothetical protein